jgi:hypothetical protein
VSKMDHPGFSPNFVCGFSSPRPTYTRSVAAKYGAYALQNSIVKTVAVGHIGAQRRVDNPQLLAYVDAAQGDGMAEEGVGNELSTGRPTRFFFPPWRCLATSHRTRSVRVLSLLLTSSATSRTVSQPLQR